ncbi:MAG: DUF1573 domain-containing protein [Phycisphaerales bacterium]|nr:DUF1573 domain-containing protein [Phycisphaerales bacterium]
MKQLLTLSIVFVLGTLSSVAQNPASFTNIRQERRANTIVPPKPIEKTTFAEFQFLETDFTHDFGSIPEGPKVKYEFKFFNVGTEPLIITNAQASCGCTSPVFSKEPVLPGKMGTIMVEYTTEGHLGNFNKSIYLTSNAKVPNGLPTFELFVKGIVLASRKDERKP